MCPLVCSSARATRVAVMCAHALRAAAGGIFLLSTTTNLCVVWPRCGSVTALPSDERQAGGNGTRRVLMDHAYPGCIRLFTRSLDFSPAYGAAKSHGLDLRHDLLLQPLEVVGDLRNGPHQASALGFGGSAR